MKSAVNYLYKASTSLDTKTSVVEHARKAADLVKKSEEAGALAKKVGKLGTKVSVGINIVFGVAEIYEDATKLKGRERTNAIVVDVAKIIANVGAAVLIGMAAAPTAVAVVGLIVVGIGASALISWVGDSIERSMNRRK